MPISHQHKCLFIHIPKTGGTSIETALDMFGDWKVENTEKLFGLIQSPEHKALNFTSNFLQHLTLEQSNAISQVPDNYISFSFVRNPWDKMVSIFSNPDNNLVETALTQDISIKELPFEEFILQADKIKHIHLEPQHSFICDSTGSIKLDFLGKFETLASDFNKLGGLLNIQLELPHKNQSNRRNYQDYYSDKTKKIIEERYQSDIDIFSYSF